MTWRKRSCPGPCGCLGCKQQVLCFVVSFSHGPECGEDLPSQGQEVRGHMRAVRHWQPHLYAQPVFPRVFVLFLVFPWEAPRFCALRVSPRSGSAPFLPCPTETRHRAHSPCVGERNPLHPLQCHVSVLKFNEYQFLRGSNYSLK